jgi:hypothetical protein
MKDRFEEFVRGHRQEFDFHEPNPALWAKIEKAIVPKKTIRWQYYLSRAAVIILLVGASLVASAYG